MIHIYHGDGKGKTTAATGLAVRASGAGLRVLFAQFFKDGSSSEIRVLGSLHGVTVSRPSLHYGLFRRMTDEEKAAIAENYRAFLEDVIAHAGDYDLIVLDESVSASRYGMIPAEALADFLKSEGQKREIVLTGRGPLPELVALADYVTEMRKEKHPFDRGISARRGIEY